MNSFTVEAFTLLAVGLSIISIRTYARWQSVGFSGFKFDDFLMVVAGVIYSLETATAYAVGAWFHGLANNGMTPEQRTKLHLEPKTEEWDLRIGGSKTQLVGWSLYTLLLWLLKFCMCGFYSRLTEGVDNMRTRVKIGYAIIAITYLATELSILLGCQPFHKNWQIYPDPGNFCQPAISKIDLYVTVVLNVSTDLYLMTIPLPILWRARLPLRRKILLVCMFCGGGFVMLAGILRCVLILRDPIGGAQQAGSWAVRETFVATIIGNLPMIYPLFRRLVRSFMDTSMMTRFSQSRTKSSQRANEAGQFHTNPSGSEASKSRSRNKRFSGGRSLYPLTTLGGTLPGSGSQERIVEEGGELVENNDGRRSAGGGGKGITVVTETIVQGHERIGTEGELHRNHWPLHSH